MKRETAKLLVLTKHKINDHIVARAAQRQQKYRIFLLRSFEKYFQNNVALPASFMKSVFEDTPVLTDAHTAYEEIIRREETYTLHKRHLSFAVSLCKL